MTMNSTNLQCKVKIGSAYEAKWFERRYTQGTYCGKNVPLDTDGMWLQGALIGCKKPHYSKRLPITIIVAALVFVLFYFTYA
jgi:hypothetical protein